MTYVAFLRGVNVGGKGIVSMTAIKEALVALGLADVRTYINSGNVIFSTRASGALQLTARIEKALEHHTGTAIKVLVIDHKTLKKTGWGWWLVLGTQVGVFLLALVQGVITDLGWFYFSSLPLLTSFLLFAFRKAQARR